MNRTLLKYFRNIVELYEFGCLLFKWLANGDRFRTSLSVIHNLGEDVSKSKYKFILTTVLKIILTIIANFLSDLISH